jgi:hypothetical protein
MATRQQLKRFIEQTLLDTEARNALRALIDALQDNIDAGGGGGQALIQFEDEGVALGTPGTADTIDFTGAGVTATRVGNAITVDVPGGGGGGPQAARIEAELKSEGTGVLVVGTDSIGIVPFDMTIDVLDEWIITASVTCSVVLDVQRATVASPNVFTSIAASAKPTLSADNYNTGAMTGWATSLLAGERVRVVAESASGTNRVQLMIPTEKT